MTWRGSGGDTKTFLGWKQEGDPDLRQAGYSFAADENVTFKAIWGECTVTFDAGDGSAAVPQRVYEHEAALRPDDPARFGYRFSAWLLDGETYDFNVPVTANITLAAAWEKLSVSVLPNDIKIIEEYAFEGTSASALYIPDGCQEIGVYAFRNCPNLVQIRIPAGCAIGEFAFDGCAHVAVFGTPGGGAEQYCTHHDNCEFIAE